MADLEKVDSLMDREGVRDAYRTSLEHRELVFSHLTQDDIRNILIEGCEKSTTLVPSSNRILKELDVTKPILRFKFNPEIPTTEILAKYDALFAKAGLNSQTILEAFQRAVAQNPLPDSDWALDTINNCYTLIIREEFTAPVTAALYDVGYNRYLETLPEEERVTMPKAILSSIFAVSCQRDGGVVQVRMVV